MASNERIDDLISKEALAHFDQLNDKVATGVLNFEKLVAKIVEVNKNLGGNIGFKRFTADTEKLTDAEKALNKQHADLAKANAQLQVLFTEEAKKIAEVKNQIGLRNQAIKEEIQLQLVGNNSLKQAAANVKALKRERDALDLSTANGIKKHNELNAAINRNNEFIQKNNDKLGQQKINIGNYPKVVEGLSNGIKTLAGAYVGLVSVEGVKEFLADSVDKFNEAQDAVSRFENTLGNVGRSDAFDRLRAKSKAFMNEFRTIDDEDILGVFDQLITYGKLTEGQIEQLTPVIIDFSAKAKISLGDATSVIIKALEGNGKALKEYGINIKDAKSTSEAFGIVMSELGPRVEGAAKAFGETTRGQIQATRVEIENLKEDVGEKLQPAIKGFYSLLSYALAGIPVFFERVSVGFKNFVGLVGASGRVLKGALTFDYTVLGKVEAELKAVQDKVKAEKEYQEIKSQGEKIAASAENQPLVEQNRILLANVALLKQSTAAYEKFTDAGQKDTAQGKAAARQMRLDFEAVRQIQAVITRSKDNRVLGLGSATTTPDATALKSFSKTYDPSTLKQEADDAKKLSEMISLELQSRLRQRQIAAEKEIEIINGVRAVEVQNEVDKLNAAKGKKGVSSNELINATNEFNNSVTKLNSKAAADIKLIETNRERDIIEIRQSSIATQKEINKKANDDTIAFFNKTDADQIKAIQDREELTILELEKGKSYEIQALDKRYQAQISTAKGNEKKILKATEEYNNDRANLEFDYAAEVLRIQIKSAQDILALHKAQGADTRKEEAAIAKAQMDLADLVTRHTIDNNAREVKSHQDKFEKIATSISKIKEISDIVTDLTGKAIDAYTIGQKNKLQAESDRIDTTKAKEIEAINASAESEQVKADKINIINARAQAQKDQIAIKERQADERKARFDKISGISNIILNTAVAVIRQFTTGDPFTAFARALAVGSIGAAQLAVAIATPIPKYRTGTKDHPGGNAIVGDGYKKELIVTPEGRLIETADFPQVMNIPKHSMVLPDSKQALEAGIATRMRSGTLVLNNDKGGAEMTAMLGRKLDRLTTTIQNKRETHIKGDYGGVVALHKLGADWWKYIDQQVHFKQ